MAITTHSQSRLSIRCATPSSESSRGTPRRLSITTRLNSPAIGSPPSRTMVSIDCASESPAERLPDISCRVSGRLPAKARSRLVRLNLR